MCRLPWTWILAVVAASIPGVAFAGPQAGEPKDWGRALRNNDKEAFIHLTEAGVDEQPFLREALRHAEAPWRMAAAQRLGDLQARWAIDILQARTQDRHPGVAIAALLALRHLGAGGGVKPFRTLVYPGADLDKKEAAGGAVEFVLLSKDGARNVSGFYEQALDDLGWARQRAIGDSELPLRCRSPWGGIYGRGPTTFLVVVCGAPTPGEQAVIHLKVRGASASKVLGTAFEKVLKDPGVR
jgi:hypothetical protein